MVAEGKGNGRHSESRKRMGGQSWGFEQGDTCWAYGRRGQAGLHGKEFGCCRDEWMDRDTGAGTVSVMASDRAKAACAPSPSGLSAAAGDRGEEPLPEVSRSTLALRTRAPRKLGPRVLLFPQLPTLPRGRAAPGRLPSRGSWNPRPRRPARFRPGRACAPASAGCAPRLCLGR